MGHSPEGETGRGEPLESFWFACMEMERFLVNWFPVQVLPHIPHGLSPNPFGIAWLCGALTGKTGSSSIPGILLPPNIQLLPKPGGGPAAVLGWVCTVQAEISISHFLSWCRAQGPYCRTRHEHGLRAG